MVMLQGQFTPSSAGLDPHASSVQFGADISQAPVFLDVDVIPSLSFSRLMLALGRVVRLQDVGVERDHSAYQEWVHGQYLKELPAQTAAGLIQVPRLIAQREELENRIASLRGTMSTYLYADPLRQERSAFWRWLYDQNRKAWMVLDPIVSVQPDATFFEAFSLDESTYARVTLPHEATSARHEAVCGTTNIDFSVTLERELARTRSYRPLHLSVGAQAVTLDTGVSSTIERKIDLPESWVRGLVEVQAALAIAPTTIEISSSALADILARLESERETHGPRSLLFDLTPGQPIRVTIEPWDDVVTVSDRPYEGAKAQQIKVWGRRRLRVLKDLLPLAPTVTVRLIDSGMPSFWSVEMDGLDLTIGLSGWTAQDWAGRARFSAMIPSSAADTEKAQAAANHLARELSLSPDELVALLNVTPTEARVLLQRLCVAGSAMFDPTTGRYRWRALFPEIDLSADTGPGREERKGIDLFQEGDVRIIADDFDGRERTVQASVGTLDKSQSVSLRRDEDGKVMYAQCDCSHFRHHKLRQGPCRHIVATSLAGG
jgi:hypothetical protein